jgi:hypothetical protein
MVNQYSQQKLEVESIQDRDFSGRIVSIAEAASITNSPYQKLKLCDRRYHLFDNNYENDDYIELAEFRNVISNHIFQLFFPEHNIAITEEASYVNALNSFPMPHEYENNSISLKWEKPLVYIDEPVLMLGGHNNHYHWILNWLPRLFVAKHFQEMFGDISNLKVCVHQGISETYIKSLETLGIKRSQLIFNSMVYKNSKEFYYFRKLYFPTFFKNTHFNLFIKDAYIRFFTETSVLKKDSSLPKLIYVSRQKEQRRRRRIVNNEDLEKCIKPFGFETVFCEDLSLEEQANIFYNADFIIGPHGAGLANIMFCRPHTKLLVFEYKKRTEFNGLANVCQLNPTMMISKQYIDEAYEKDHPKFQSRLRDLIVDLDLLESHLKDTLLIAN